MNLSSVYHTVNVFNEGRYVLGLDFTDKCEAIREAIAFQEDGFGTELLTLSTANMFDTAPDNYNPDVERIAY